MNEEIIKDTPQSDVVISSRVRLARNFNNYPFPSKMKPEDGQKILNKVGEVVFEKANAIDKKFKFENIQKLKHIERQVLVEKHLISPDLARGKTVGGAIISDDEKVSIMVNEEDHLRIQCVLAGLRLDDAWHLCSKIDDLLEDSIDYAFDEKLGYLTCCPTNIGTGIRVSAMLHLPALVMTGYIKGILEICSKLGIVVRGFFGENTEALGNVFQISNQVSLGQSEEDIIFGINNIAEQIIGQERNLRNTLYKQNPHRFEDKVYRSLGILSNARIISTEEALKLISDVRLGVYMGIINNIDVDTLSEIQLLAQPANLQKNTEGSLNPGERDIKRAEVIRNKILRAINGFK